MISTFVDALSYFSICFFYCSAHTIAMIGCVLELV